MGLVFGERNIIVSTHKPHEETIHTEREQATTIHIELLAITGIANTCAGLNRMLHFIS